MSSDAAKRAGSVWTLRWNIFSSYVSQMYSTLIGIVMVPMYLKYMGTEAYGLIGIFAILQLCVQSLDMGITPTLSREAARSRSGATTALSLRQLLRSFEMIFLALGILLVAGIAVGAGYLATKWVNSSHLEVRGIKQSLVLMAAIAWLRWFAGLYRGIVNGYERQVWQSGVNIAIATAHSVAVIPYLIYVGATPAYFFVYQLAISVIDFLLVSRKSYGLLPPVDRGALISFQFGALRRVFRFSAVIALTTGLWVVVTQTDKILLSRILSLADFGVFSLATLVAGGVMTLSAPLRIALLPRLTELSARNEQAQLVRVYRNATQFTTVLAFSAALFLALFARQVLWVWTGNAGIVSEAATTLALYALGNGIAAFGAFPYYLQYAKGEVSLHLVGTILFLVVLVPSVVLLTLKYGAIGAGSAWLGSNLIFLLCWVPYVHRRFVGRFHLDWISRDIVSIALVTTVVGVVAKNVVVWPASRLGGGVLLFLIALLFVVSAAAASSFARRSIFAAFARLQSLRGAA